MSGKPYRKLTPSEWDSLGHYLYGEEKDSVTPVDSSMQNFRSYGEPSRETTSDSDSMSDIENFHLNYERVKDENIPRDSSFKSRAYRYAKGNGKGMALETALKWGVKGAAAKIIPWEYLAPIGIGMGLESGDKNVTQFLEMDKPVKDIVRSRAGRIANAEISSDWDSKGPYDEGYYDWESIKVLKNCLTGLALASSPQQREDYSKQLSVLCNKYGIDRDVFEEKFKEYLKGGVEGRIRTSPASLSNSSDSKNDLKSSLINDILNRIKNEDYA